jgi:glycosyltransferase involved in cell wall biosynthesis
VSVVVPAFDGENRIAGTLRQLRHQTFRDFEIVVVDDGSRDGTAAVVRRLVNDDPRIRLVEQANRGTAGARNRGIAEARGDLIAFLDDDDLWLPQKLELQVARLDEVPKAAVVSCFSALVDADHRLLGWRFGGETEGDVYREMLEWDMVSGGSVALARRAALEEVGGYDESLRHRADWDLWIRLSRTYSFTCVPQALVGYTRRAGSTSRDSEEMVEEGRIVLARASREDPDLDPSEEHALLGRDLFGTACLCLIDGERASAWRYLMRALRSGPGRIIGQPRRWGVILMLVLATLLPRPLYTRALAVMSRRAFQLEPGEPFESLDRSGSRERV